MRCMETARNTPDEILRYVGMVWSLRRTAERAAVMATRREHCKVLESHRRRLVEAGGSRVQIADIDRVIGWAEAELLEDDNRADRKREKTRERVRRLRERRKAPG